MKKKRKAKTKSFWDSGHTAFERGKRGLAIFRGWGCLNTWKLGYSTSHLGQSLRSYGSVRARDGGEERGTLVWAMKVSEEARGWDCQLHISKVTLCGRGPLSSSPSSATSCHYWVISRAIGEPWTKNTYLSNSKHFWWPSHDSSLQVWRTGLNER